jgi:uncharacterized protein YceK
MIRGISFLLFFFLISGCASVDRRWFSDGSYNVGVYPGVRQDYDDLNDFFKKNWEGRPDLAWFWPISLPVYAVDMVLSAALDTICLPYDLPKAAFYDPS